MISKNRPKLVITSLIAALSLVVIAACGTSQDNNEQDESLVESLPANLQEFYEGFTDPIKPSAYDDFESADSPWKVCLVYDAANAWIEEVRKEMQRVVQTFDDAGKSATFEIAETNGEVALENRQIRAMTSKECSIILLAPSSPSSSNAAIKAAYDKGIPVVSFGGAVTSEYAINVVPNSALYGKQQAEGLVARVGGGTNVLMIGGIEGLPASIAQAKGAAEVWEENDVNVVATVYGNYDLATTKSVVLQTLSTHTEKIDAVWTAGSEIRAVVEAFQQAGRPVPPITGTPSADVLAMMKENSELDLFGRGSVPIPVADIAIRVTLRMLDGQHPRLGTITFVLPEWNRDNLDEWYESCMQATEQLPFPVPPVSPLSEDEMDQYFSNGSPVDPYEYDPVRPCS